MLLSRKARQAHAVSLLLNVRFRYQLGEISAETARKSAKYTITVMTKFPNAVADAERFVLGETNVMFGQQWSQTDFR